MIGAIIGDIVGSRFEANNHKSKDFEFFQEDCRPTDDSIMTMAISDSIIFSDEDNLEEKSISFMQAYGRMYPHAGYGGMFSKWLKSSDPQPYGSFGNGAVMRVSPCGFLARSVDEAMEMATAVTKITHNHRDAILGATTIAAGIFLLEEYHDKEEFYKYVSDHYYMEFNLDDIRDGYKFDVSCQGTVPVAVEAFIESNDFEDAIRNAISIGGDSDTIACVTGALAEAYYGVPKMIETDALTYLDNHMLACLYQFERERRRRYDQRGI